MLNLPDIDRNHCDYVALGLVTPISRDSLDNTSRRALDSEDTMTNTELATAIGSAMERPNPILLRGDN